MYSADLSPDEISAALAIAPSRSFGRDPASDRRAQQMHNFWSWSTRDLTESTDHLDHLRLIFEALRGKQDKLAQLRSQGVDMTISVYWDSDGQGGPSLDLPAIAELHQLGLDIWWDIYFVAEQAETTGETLQ